MEQTKVIALVPVLDGIPQLPIFVGTEEGAQQYWEDNPLNFLNRRVDTWDVCPCCKAAYPELTESAFGDEICQKCSDSITADLMQLKEEAEADAAWRVTPCGNCGQATTNDGLCHDCSDMVTGDIDEPELEPCEHCGAGTYNGPHDFGLILCGNCGIKFDNHIGSPDDELPF